MSVSVREFHHDLFQEVHNAADADGVYTEDAFFDLFGDHLVAAGEIETADRASILFRGMRVDGYGGDPIVSDNVLSLIVADFNQSPATTTLNADDMNSLFKRTESFLRKSLEPEFRNSLEETSPAFGLADLVAKRWPTLAKIRLFLISNRLLRIRVDSLPAGSLHDVPVTYNVWDLERLHRFATSGQGREEIEIDLESDFGGPLHALPAHLHDAGYEAYLVVVPGEQLASIYERWGSRLLEQNVRVFLQARGNVNKGIRNTIEHDPTMFFAYNNGITATAEKVETRMSDAGLLLTGLKNLQIVNGGQTTASIHAESRRKDGDLSQIFVQMKLSVVEPAKAVEVVPRISEYANSQNRVNPADFFANHPFHVRMEEFSRRLYAPAPDGSFLESKWFYERARGQYQDARAHMTRPQKRKFENEFPKQQVFSKTDLAKYLNVWQGHPDIVSQGAQKNFARFAAAIGAEWAKQPDAFNETFYRHAIAKAIVFREVEKLVSSQPWYEGGYRANIVAYAIAKLGFDIQKLGRQVDFDAIWRAQNMTSNLRDAMIIASKEVHSVITAPPAGMRNVTEWAKQQACWQRVKDMKIDWPQGLLDDSITDQEQQGNENAAIKGQKVLNGIQAQAAVVTAGGAFWSSLLDWGLHKRLLPSKDVDILRIAAAIPDKLPTERQSVRVVQTLKRLQAEGCQMDIEIE